MTQSQALAILKTGANVFLTGEPGSGKTYTINQYIKYLREQGIEPAVTASTGIAATHLNGMTIHSWSGIGIRRQLSSADLEYLALKRQLVSRVLNTSVLIIDEISMLDDQTLAMVDKLLRYFRQNPSPFGGLQVIFVGDFFQLPPVVKEGEGTRQFAYLSQSWIEADPAVCYLSEQHRQQDDKFLYLLSMLRQSELNEDVIEILQQRLDKISADQNLTRLYSHNIDVNNLNEQHLTKLSTKPYQYQMTSRGAKPLIETLIKSCLSPETLILKLGAFVMFTKNSFEQGFVNGTLGEVTDFNEAGLPIVTTKSGRKITVQPAQWSVNDGQKTLATIEQLPLRLAWAITVHKSQGMTLEAAIIDLSQAFEYGQGYVALSRVRNLEGLYLKGFNQRSLEVHPQIFEDDQKFRQLSVQMHRQFDLIPEAELGLRHQQFIKSIGGKSRHKESEQSTYDQTLELYQRGQTISQIAKKRNLNEGTIINHFEKLVQLGQINKLNLAKIATINLPKSEINEVTNAFKNIGSDKLSPIYSHFNGKYPYDTLRLIRLTT